jgi:polyhydroxyalkanoate synthase
MAKQQQADQLKTDSTASPEEIAQIMSEIADRSRVIVEDFLKRQPAGDGTGRSIAGIGQTFLELTQRMMTNPNAIMEAQFGLWQDYMRLWQSTAQRMLGQEPEPVIAPEKGDRRFRDAAWNDNILFDFIKQSYLLSSRYVLETASRDHGMEPREQQKVEFYTRQFVDALAPSNFVMTNPEVLRATLESRGENLLRGLKHMLEDLDRGKGRLSIRMTDLDAFEVGRNIATTPGKVVYQNELMQLIQYTPTTETVYKRPLMIVPPWINKFYILDLQPQNSFIRFAVEQGFTVFVISWVNPDEEMSHKTFESYMLEGPLAALDAIEQATGEKDVTAIGYCLGGTLLAATLSYMTAKKDNRIKASTYFTTLLDFSDPGELGVFIDEEQLALVEEKMMKRGYLDGSEMANTFNMLRANDLIWSFVVNNYLMGREPPPFDLLYWNADSTRLPATMLLFYIQEMYKNNALGKPGRLKLDGVAIDLGKVTVPVYIFAAKDDHITPWRSCYPGTQLFGGPKRFVLAASGHIAGVINPPAAKKYSHWTNPKLPPTPEEWLEGAESHEGSWWPDQARWLGRRAGAQVAARQPGDGALQPIEDAPGSYVRERASD